MKHTLLLVFCLLAVSLAAVPNYIDFQLELDYMLTSASYTFLIGTLTVTNNGPVTWDFENNIGFLAYLRADGMGSFGTLWMPFHLILPPQQSVSLEIEGSVDGLGPGVHYAQAFLVYDYYSHEPVGNTVPFSIDQTLSSFDDLDWDLQINNQGADVISAVLTGVNDSNYQWKKSFPYTQEMAIGLDGNIPQPVFDPDPHNVYAGPHNHVHFDLLLSSDEPFTPGNHSVQAYALDTGDSLVPVGEPAQFHVQDSGVDDAVPQARLSARIFPNPLRKDSVLSVNVPSSVWKEVRIFDIKGRMVGSGTRQNLRNGSQDLPLQDLLPPDISPGIYLFRLQIPNATVCIKALYQP
jgi:hypothetical protein